MNTGEREACNTELPLGSSPLWNRESDLQAPCTPCTAGGVPGTGHSLGRAKDVVDCLNHHSHLVVSLPSACDALPVLDSAPSESFLYCRGILFPLPGFAPAAGARSVTLTSPVTWISAFSFFYSVAFSPQAAPSPGEPHLLLSEEFHLLRYPGLNE